MRINCGADLTSRKQRLENWHRWFAWHPMVMPSGDLVWLEWIERKITYGYDHGPVADHREIPEEISTR